MLAGGHPEYDDDVDVLPVLDQADLDAELQGGPDAEPHDGPGDNLPPLFPELDPDFPVLGVEVEVIAEGAVGLGDGEELDAAVGASDSEGDEESNDDGFISDFVDEPSSDEEERPVPPRGAAIFQSPRGRADRLAGVDLIQPEDCECEDCIGVRLNGAWFFKVPSRSCHYTIFILK